MHHTQRRQHAEIGQHDRAEQLAHLLGAARLQREQAHEDRDRGGHDPRFEPGDDILQALGRREHRDRRGDHAVTIEQRGGEHPEQHQRRGPPGRIGGAADQRQQRQAPALALVVGAGDGEDVLDGHHHHHRPEHQAQHPVDMRGVRRDTRRAVVRGEGFAEGVKRAGADIAEHHADRADRESQRGCAVAVAMAVAGIRRCRGSGAGHLNRISRQFGTAHPAQATQAGEAARLALCLRSRNMGRMRDTWWTRGHHCPCSIGARAIMSSSRATSAASPSRHGASVGERSTRLAHTARAARTSPLWR